MEDGEKVNDSNCDMEVDAAYSGLENPRFQKINDPGFDWSLSGFNITDLLKVGKRQKSRSQCEESYEVTESDEAVKNALEEMGLDLMASTEAYDQKLFGNPNSSGLWISYMAFFLGQKSWPVKKRYENAKAVAERALESINCKSVQIFYLFAIIR